MMSRPIVVVVALFLIGAGTMASTQAPPATLRDLAGGRDDVRRLEVPTNEGRFDAITALLRERGVRFEVERFTIEPRGSERRTEGRNVVVTLGSGEGTVVVCAHYDAARLPDGSLSRGAIDNASSSVILVRLAEALGRDVLKKRVKLVFFDMEEVGLVGSTRYLETHGPVGIDAVVNLDINAAGDTVIYGPAHSAINAQLRRAFVESCAARDIPCVGFGTMPPGDDRTFSGAAVPTLSVAILPAVEVHQLWLRIHGGEQSGLASGTVPSTARTIHTADDQSDKVESAAMKRVFDLILHVVRTLAANE